jgi:FKBP-type peptidyl-prolyl cis-trans isomerase FkpA
MMKSILLCATRRRATRLALAGAGAVVLAGCSSAPSSDTGRAAETAPQPRVGDIERVAFNPSLGIHLDSMSRRASGLYVQDLVTGTGAVATIGRTVVVGYTGWLPNGTEFDSGEVTVTLGTNKTIRAWEEGLLGMRVGGKRRLVVPPSLGYGDRAAGDIPANAVLVFEMQVTSVF